MFWPDRVPAALRRIYGVSRQVDQDMSRAPQALEEELLARHARLYPAPRGLRGFAQAHRWALVSGLGALGVAAACQVPLDYERDFGASVRCEAEVVALAHDSVRGLADRLQQHTGARQVAVQIEESAQASLRIDLWGASSERVGGALLAEIEAQVAVPAASCTIEPLVGTVHGTLGGRLGLELFDHELLDHEDVEAARAQILERLAARGLHGQATIEIEERSEGRREIKIQIEAQGEVEGEVKD